MTVLTGHRGMVIAARLFPPPLPFAVTAAMDGTGKVWDLGSGRIIDDFSPGGGLKSLDVSERGDRLLTVRGDGAVQLWNVELDTQSAGRFGRFVACHVPYRLNGQQLVAATPDCAP